MARICTPAGDAFMRYAVRSNESPKDELTPGAEPDGTETTSCGT